LKSSLGKVAVVNYLDWFIVRLKSVFNGRSTNVFMILLGQLKFVTDTPDRHIGMLAITGLAAYGILVFVRWMLQGPKTPDPWGDEVAAEIEGENAQPLCPHCLARHGELEHFCPDCGAPVGACTSLMPPLYLFSIGHILRMGTAGTFKRSPFLVAGYFFASFTGFAFLTPFGLLTPVYWFMLLKNITRLRSSNQPGAEPPVDSRE
jgi:hypothetical protein